MAFFLFAISFLGLALLIACLFMLLSPFLGWKCQYKATVTQMTANIPKAGRYSINVRRDRFWLWKNQGNISDMLPKVNFLVQWRITGEEVQYVPHRSLMTSSSGTRMTVLTGYFDALRPGNYIITSLLDSRFFENEEIVIRKHLPTAKFVLLIWGIIIGALMFIMGLTFGILTLAGVFTTMPSLIPDTYNISPDTPGVPSIIQDALGD